MKKISLVLSLILFSSLSFAGPKQDVLKALESEQSYKKCVLSIDASLIALSRNYIGDLNSELEENIQDKDKTQTDRILKSSALISVKNLLEYTTETILNLAKVNQDLLFWSKSDFKEIPVDQKTYDILDSNQKNFESAQKELVKKIQSAGYEVCELTCQEKYEIFNLDLKNVKPIKIENKS